MGDEATKEPTRGFPGGAVIKNPPANAGEMGSSPGGGRSQDRKSTRLNSSHRCISYAVFCLKKKTTG